MGVPYSEESNADLYWKATSRLEVLSGRLKAMERYILATRVDNAIGSLCTVSKGLEK